MIYLVHSSLSERVLSIDAMHTNTWLFLSFRSVLEHHLCGRPCSRYWNQNRKIPALGVQILVAEAVIKKINAQMYDIINSGYVLKGEEVKHGR